MIKTVEQYLESLNDGRQIWCLGEKVSDVRTHPTLSSIIKTACMDYVLPNHPDFRDLFVTKNEEGEDINFLLTSPRSPEDLLRRRECYINGVRSGGGVMVHCMGADALAAFTVAAEVMDKEIKTNYMERVENYRKLLQRQDLAITGAITDVKGDRSLHASKQKQHPDYYLRILDKQKDGIVVRGAKVHISATPCANEALCLPCRTHGEEDKDYALAFAIPLNAPGIKLLAVEPVSRTYGEEGEFDYPKTSATQPTECLIVFDDVFVPWERVFMCGEWQYTRNLAYAFASNFHQMCQYLQDIAGGLSATVPTFRNWNNTEIRPYIEKYLSGKDGISTEDRLRVVRLAKDMTCNFYQIDTIHGEGSMAAQEMFLYGSADWNKLKSAAKRAAHVDGWQDNPIYGRLLSAKEQVKMPVINESYESIPKTARKK